MTAVAFKPSWGAFRHGQPISHDGPQDDRALLMALMEIITQALEDLFVQLHDEPGEFSLGCANDSQRQCSNATLSASLDEVLQSLLDTLRELSRQLSIGSAAAQPGLSDDLSWEFPEHLRSPSGRSDRARTFSALQCAFGSLLDHFDERARTQALNHSTGIRSLDKIALTRETPALFQMLLDLLETSLLKIVEELFKALEASNEAHTNPLGTSAQAACDRHKT